MTPLRIFNATQPARSLGVISTPLEHLIGTAPRLIERLQMHPFRAADVLATFITEADALQIELLAEARQAAARATKQELKAFLRTLVTAWPNASQNDLAGYSAQLAQDLERQRPSRYALIEGGRRLRRECRFMPSICEVLDVIEQVDDRMLRVVGALDQLPAVLERARRDLDWEVRRAFEERRQWDEESARARATRDPR